MATKTNPAVKIMLDKPRTLKFDLNALAAFEDTTGKSFLRGLSLSGLTTKDLRALIWAGLLHEDPALTLEQVGAMVHAGNLPDIDRQIGIALGVSLPDTEEDAGAVDPTLTQ